MAVIGLLFSAAFSGGIASAANEWKVFSLANLVGIFDGAAAPFSVSLGETSFQETALGAAEGTVVGFSNPSSAVMPARGGLKNYKIQKGDTLSKIAARFGISLETIRRANSNLASPLKVGSTLIILPVSGVLYEIVPGDLLETVAARYQVDAASIKRYNADYQRLFTAGHGTLVLPNAKEPRGDLVASRALPDLKDYFALPATGWNWGALHPANAVDIGGKCDTPVVASADGLVMETVTNNAWNGGYGNSVVIEHPNGTRTRYAHLGKVSARVGAYVTRGTEIGVMGETGASHGPKECSLHFEVEGAKNPFAVR